MTLAATSHLNDQNIHLLRLGEVFFRTDQVFFQEFQVECAQVNSFVLE